MLFSDVWNEKADEKIDENYFKSTNGFKILNWENILFFFVFFGGFICLLVREVGDVQGYLYPMSGKSVGVPPPPPPPRSATFSGLVRHGLHAVLK